MSASISSLPRSLLALALTSVLAACGGGGSSDGGSPADGDGGDGGGNVVEPSPDDGSTSDPDDGDKSKASYLEWDANSTLMSDSGLRGNDPTVAISESGNIVVAWIEDTSPNTVWGRYYDKATDTWSDARQLDKGDATPSAYYERTNPQIAFVGETAVVVWDQQGVVYSSIHDDNGWSGNPQVIDGTDLDYQAIGISVAAKGDGTGAVVAYEYREPNESPVIRASDYSFSKATWSQPVQLSTTDVTAPYGIQMVTDPEIGAVHAVWEGDRVERETNFKLMSASYEDGSWTTPELIATDTFNSVTIQADPDSDRPVVAWVSGNDAIAARFEGGAWATEDLGAKGYKQKAIESAVMSDGDMVITYQGEPTQGMENIVLQRMDAESGDWSAPVLTDNKYRVFRPSVATDGNGRLVVAYYQYNTWATEYTEEEGFLDDYQPAGLNSGRENKVVMNDAGDAALVWLDSNGGRIRVLMGR